MPNVPSLGNGIAVPIEDEDFPSWLEQLRASNHPAHEGVFLVDWSGVRTRIPMLPWAPQELAGTSTSDLPIPDDGYRSEDFEYVALARAIGHPREEPFRLIEVGAGWAPWAVAGLVQARLRGLPALAIAVEADSRKCQWAQQHAHDNGFVPVIIDSKAKKVERELTGAISNLASEGQHLVIVHAAGWHETTTVSFPETAIDDMGAAVWTLPGTDVDYRGAHVRHRDVPAISLSTLVEASRLFGDDNGTVDLLHVDVQGVEFDLLQQVAGPIQDNTRLMAIGTHSRWSEGHLQQFFLARGWGLLIDKPCKAHFTMTHPTLSGFTVQDGMQLYENPFVLVTQT